MLELATGKFASLTPYGAFYAVTEAADDAIRRLLQAILREPGTEALSDVQVCRWIGSNDIDAALDLLKRLQSLAMIQVTETPLSIAPLPLEELLPQLIAPLSGAGKALLADAHGFYLATVGFPREVAEELAALSADIATLHTRHSHLLAKNLDFSGSSWGLLDPAGASQLGIWPLYVGETRFALAIAGRPRLNQEAFAQLVQALARRYSAPASTAAEGS
jgi:hypothetical protein